MFWGKEWSDRQNRQCGVLFLSAALPRGVTVDPLASATFKEPTHSGLCTAKKKQKVDSQIWHGLKMQFKLLREKPLIPNNISLAS